MSARLSPDAVYSLLHDTKAAAIITSRRLQSTAQQALSKFNPAKRPSTHRPVPYQVLLDGPLDDCQRSICAEGHYVHEYDRNVIILHSSGSTGKPKTIYNSHRYLLGYATAHEFASDAEAQALNLCTLPLYHAYGIMPIFMSLQIGETFCIPVCPDPPNGPSVMRLVRQAGARSLMTVPSILEELYDMRDDKVWQTLSSLNFVLSAGGPLKPALGEFLVSRDVSLLTSYGCSEVGCIGITYVPGPGDRWDFVHLRQDMDIKLSPIEDVSGQTTRYRISAKAFGWSEPFEPSDELEVRDASLRQIRPMGRLDDVIVLGNGEKVAPYALESAIGDLSEVKAAVAFGNGRFQLGVMIELAEEASWDGVDAKIWEVIAATNNKLDGHARITSPQAILKLPGNRTIPKTDKGNISRKAAYDTFGKEIQAVYDVLDSTTASTMPNPGDDNLESIIRHLLENELTWDNPKRPWDVHDDLFEMGMDSLQAVSLRRLVANVPNAFPRHAVTTNFVYENPTIAKMCQRLRRGHCRQVSKQFTRQTRIDDLVSKYTDASSLRSISRPCSPTEPQYSVLLVGSTGGVGSHLLYELLRDPLVSSVTCLNRARSADLLDTQYLSFADQGLPVDGLPWHKCEHVATDPSSPTLGMSRSQYIGLTHTLTHIVHNAWPVDFLRRLPSFERHIQVTHHLLRLALDVYRNTEQPVRFQFVSTIGTVARYPTGHRSRIVPEVSMDSCESTVETGYGESKLTCEKIIEAVQRDRPDEIDACVVRLGQISGSRRSGAWKASEYIPSLWRCSSQLGYLPRLKGTFAWIPVDDAARILSELLFASSGVIARPPSSRSASPTMARFGRRAQQQQQQQQLIYHVENPMRQPWADVMPVIASSLSIPEERIVALPEWVQRLKDATKNEGIEDTALVEFFDRSLEYMACGGVVMDTSEARKRSETMRSMEELSEEVLVSYFDSWKERGVLGGKKSPKMRELEWRLTNGEPSLLKVE